MQENKHWYIVYTRPYWEKKVADLLTKKKIESYCPLKKVVHPWSFRKKTVYEPMLTSYVFVSATQANLLSIKQTDGVISFLYWLGTPAIIKNDEISAIKNFVAKYSNIKLQKMEVNTDEKVKTMFGPSLSIEEDIVEIKNKTIKLFLPSLGYVMVAEVDYANLEGVNTLLIQKHPTNYNSAGV